MTMSRLLILTLFLATSSLSAFVSGALIDLQQEKCVSLASCSTCLSYSFCKWCVTQNKCSRKSCGIDSVIYPDKVIALLAGSQFCPRVAETDKELVFKSGQKEVIPVKLKHIYVYMAFTPWNCRVSVDGNETVVNAIIQDDTVLCEPVSFDNVSNKSYVDGTVTVLWDNIKVFDGFLNIKVCRCDLEPSCEACTK